jgi:hypothetical protein
MTDYRRFLETVLDSDIVTLSDSKIYLLASRIMADPFIQSRYEPLLAAWWTTNPYSDLDVSDDPDPNAPDVVVEQPDFYMQIAESLQRNDRLAFRKKYTP